MNANPKIVVVGVNHAGTQFCINARKMHPDAEIVAYDMNDNISFLGCGIALWVEGVVKNDQDLFYASPKILGDMRVEVHMRHEVVSVDYENKKLVVRNLTTQATLEQTYDKLVISVGSWPNVPPIPGIDSENILVSKLYQHGQEIIRQAKLPEIKEVAIIGAGFIGIELVEALQKHGKQVRLIEALPDPFPLKFDPEFGAILNKSLEKSGTKVHYNEMVRSFKATSSGAVRSIVTDHGEYSVDMVILSIGFHPNTKVFAHEKLKTLKNGAIIVDEYQQTSIPDVFAIGDCCSMYDCASQKNQYIALATNAIKSGINAAMNIAGPKHKFPGYVGTSGLCVFGDHFACTGMTEATAKKSGFNVTSVTVSDNARPEFMQEFAQYKLKIVFDADSERLLGAQFWSNGDNQDLILTLALAVQRGLKVLDLAFIDVYFLPHYNKPVNAFLASVVAVLDRKLGLNTGAK